MTIQKITAVTSLNQGKKLQKTQVNNSQTASNVDKTSSKGNEAIKNNFMSGISFKGYSRQVSRTRQWYEGTSGSLATLYPSDVPRDSNTVVINGYKGYDEQTSMGAKCSVYYADPGEKIDSSVMHSHMFVVTSAKEPEKNITPATIGEVEKASDLLAIIDDLKITVSILEEKERVAKKELEDAEQELTVAEQDLAAANTNYAAAVSETQKKLDAKTEAIIELAEYRKKLALAQEKYEAVKAREEAEYIAAERSRKLNEIQTEINSVEKSADEQIRLINAAREAKIAELMRQKKDLIDD